MTDHFYITLPSDAAKLYERIFPREIAKSVDPSSYIRRCGTTSTTDGKYWMVFTTISIELYVKSGYYPSGDAFASSLTHHTARTFAHISGKSAKCTFVERANRILMQIHSSPVPVLVLPKNLLEFLGL
jgi:hypothetical protein